MRTKLLTSVFLIAFGSSAIAQDFTADPAYGRVDLNAGFTPDPYTVQITSGGQFRASNAGSNCRGWVANAPDYSVYYTAGSFDLTIGADSDSDTTLLVNGPNGNWYCDDDSGDGLNPLLTFNNPGSGRYDIWIGSYSEGDYASARLSVSELGRVSENTGGGSGYSGNGPDFTAEPAFGRVNLNAGFTPDPYTATITSGGMHRASDTASNCRGWVATASDYSVQYSAGSFDLTIGSTSDSDTTLLINGPNGNWYCDDDSGEGLNPLVTFNNPQSGRYDIWIGSYSEGDYAQATLSVSELGRTTGGGGSMSGPDFSLPATFGNISLSAGFQPDPYRIDIVSGGRYRASMARSGCAGWVAGAPDLQLSYSAGSLPLIISAASNSDTTLLVNDPNGNWHCDDDGGNSGLNPALTFHNAASGTYDIWLGSYSEGDGASASLSISELYSE